MRVIVSALLCVVSLSTFAVTKNLYIVNASDKIITVVKADGSKYTLQPQEKIENIPFEEYSTPGNYINGHFVCKWQRLYSDSINKLVGLRYDNPYGDKFECLTEYVQPLAAK